MSSRLRAAIIGAGPSGFYAAAQLLGAAEHRFAVTDSMGTHHVGEYVTGWIKRGPSGVIGTNKKDSREAIDEVERLAGKESNPMRPRVKLARWEALRDAAGAGR